MPSLPSTWRLTTNECLKIQYGIRKRPTRKERNWQISGYCSQKCRYPGQYYQSQREKNVLSCAHVKIFIVKQLGGEIIGRRNISPSVFIISANGIATICINLINLRCLTVFFNYSICKCCHSR